MTTVNFDLIRDRHALPGGRLSFLTLVSCSDDHVFLRYAARRRVRQGILSTQSLCCGAIEKSIDIHIRAKFRRAPQPSRQVRIRKFGEIPTTDPAFSLCIVTRPWCNILVLKSPLE